MQDICNYIPDINYVPRDHSVAAILLLLFMVLISLVSVLNLLYFYISTLRSTMVAQWLKYCATNRKVAGFSGFFTDIKFFWSHYALGVDSASNRNEYQVHYLQVKAAGATILRRCHEIWEP